MNRREVKVLDCAISDLREAINFYKQQDEALGNYFLDSLSVDLESLTFYSGIHSKHFGFYRMLSKRFPFAIYYGLKNDLVLVAAVLDMRRNPAWNRNRLRRRR
ncbi:MAG: type II toxin-antitoxin system RelE/ParE family toxin [Fibrobacterota bacterium]